LIIVVLISIWIAPLVVLASPPAIPLLVYGNAAIDGQPVSVGSKISAEINNQEVSITEVTKEGRYYIEVPDGKDNEGEMITFKINGIVNSAQLQCVNIVEIPSVKFNLAVITPTSPSETPTVSSGGGGGGGSASFTPPPSYEIGDANKDNKVDKYDFALMMSAWNQTGASSSDLNGDNKVDKYDFALLMFNWGVI